MEIRKHKLVTITDDQLSRFLRGTLGLPDDARIEDARWSLQDRALKVVVSSEQYPPPIIAGDLWGDFQPGE